MEHSTHHLAHNSAHDHAHEPHEHHHSHLIEHQHPEKYAFYKSKKFLAAMFATVVFIAGVVAAGEANLFKSLLFRSGTTTKSVTIEVVTPAANEVGRVKILNQNSVPVSFDTLKLEDSGAYAKGADYRLIISQANSDEYMSVIGETAQTGSLEFKLNSNVSVPAKSYRYLIVKLLNPAVVSPRLKYDFKVEAAGDLLVN